MLKAPLVPMVSVVFVVLKVSMAYMAPIAPKVDGFMERVGHRSYATNFRRPIDEIRLTDEGKRFIPKIWKKFNAADDDAPELGVFEASLQAIRTHPSVVPKASAMLTAFMELNC